MMKSVEELSKCEDEDLLRIATSLVIKNSKPSYIDNNGDRDLTVLSYTKGNLIAQVSVNEKCELNIDAVMVQLKEDAVMCLTPIGDYSISTTNECYKLKPDRDFDVISSVRKILIEEMSLESNLNNN